MKRTRERKWVQQVQAQCVNCGTKRWLNPGDKPVCEKDYGPMFAIAARLTLVKVVLVGKSLAPAFSPPAEET